MKVPAYLLPRPAMDLNTATVAAFEQILAEAVMSEEPISYTVDVPKWQFLCWVTEQKEILLHGSGDLEITRFEPRQSNDIHEFGNRMAIYAASDGLWPLYFAILNRRQYHMRLCNGCIRFGVSPGRQSDPYYFFSISQSALQHQPWRSGMIYLLPRATFEPQMPFSDSETEVIVQQWASPVPVMPLTRLSVTPDDFPFLAQIRGHDDATLLSRAETDPDGFPWLDD